MIQRLTVIPGVTIETLPLAHSGHLYLANAPGERYVRISRATSFSIYGRLLNKKDQRIGNRKHITAQYNCRSDQLF